MDKISVEHLPALVEVEGAIWIARRAIQMTAYDFDFEVLFSCRHPAYLDREVVAIARMGAAQDYHERFQALLEHQIRLIHTPEQYDLCSELPRWCNPPRGLSA